jgi:hypothetical protein
VTVADESSNSGELVTTSVATRTLTAAGFRITGFQRSISHIEYVCERPDVFGVSQRYVFLIFETDHAAQQIVDVRSAAARESGAAVVVVSRLETANTIAWQYFLDALGGAVPSWRALSDEFFAVLKASGQNKKTTASDEEPWRVFEDAVADAFEFLFGRRVRRLGGQRRGSRVPDSLALTPDGALIVIDTKASGSPFDLTYDELRPLKEYVKNQQIRQTGSQPVNAAVLVADSFRQDQQRLQELSQDFFADVQVPITFARSDTIAAAVRLLVPDVRMRNKLRWRRCLCVGGLVEVKIVEQELQRARDEAVVGN